MAKAIILMGVSGSGKTSVGQRLAEILDWPFYDGDEYHPKENILKMSQGIPLDDQDRRPWLANLNQLINKNLESGKSILLACSALKRDYRRQLSESNPGTIFVYLRGDFDTIYNRLTERVNHYMQANMLQSQFAALEEPIDALVVEINKEIEIIVKEIIVWIDTQE